MIPFQPNQMMGIMGGLPQGGVRPFQPSRGPTGFGNRERFGGLMMSNPFQGMGFGMGGQPQPQPQPVPRGGMTGFNTSGTFQDYMDSFNASPFSQIATPLREDTFNQQFGGQPQPPQVSQQPAIMTPSFGNMGGAFGAGIGSIFNRFRNPAGFTPTGFSGTPFLPTPPPPGGFRRPGALSEDQRMTLTTANPFSSGPDAQDPMLGNRFNQARMNAGMGGIASLMPPSMRPAPPGAMRPMDQGLRDELRRLQQAFLGNMPQPAAQPNPSQLQAQQQVQAAFGGGFGGLMPQG